MCKLSHNWAYTFTQLVVYLIIRTTVFFLLRGKWLAMQRNNRFYPRFQKLLVIMVVSGLLSACSGERHANKYAVKKHEVDNKRDFLLTQSPSVFSRLANIADIKSRILRQYQLWKGTGYRMGGNTRRGIDCSAFVQRTFQEQFNLTLPRSTRGQKEMGNSIARHQLVAGDLVLFRAGPTGRHIGIYLGNDKFVHASSSVGVVISDLNEHYWHNRYWKARRVLNSSSIHS